MPFKDSLDLSGDREHPPGHVGKEDTPESPVWGPLVHFWAGGDRGGTPQSSWEFPPNSPLNEFLEDGPTQVLADFLNVGLGRTQGSTLGPQGHPGHPNPTITWGLLHPWDFTSPPLPLPGPQGCFCHLRLWGPQHHQPWGPLG